MMFQEIKLGTGVIPHFNVILTLANMIFQEIKLGTSVIPHFNVISGNPFLRIFRLLKSI